ncbi:N-acetyltransferase [Paenibacillus sambharensis]|uniref:N-acetyltransferase n=1 Tax=Paenibacillus sambharensis TaxID=1803190 RepID=A0A2W1LAB1_9BACL|nr:N-acetyltransferase [Paenibacillus sambharensis]PZD95823.1 N-acetyltransferase [Paenibacillus sambharensis]
MQIRKADETDYEELVQIWLEGSIDAHHFVDPEYWRSMSEEMRTKYLPMASTYIIEQDGAAAGFVSMVDDYLAALFVAAEYRNQGYGRELIHHVKQLYDRIELKVYRRNDTALNFYKRSGFIIGEEGTDEHTKEQEYVMLWQKNKAGGVAGCSK